MFGFSNRRSPRYNNTTTHRRHHERSTGRRSMFHRTDPDRRAGGLKAALHNPNTTHDGRKRAKYELRSMGRGREAHGHPSLGSRLRHMFGIRSSRTRRADRRY